MHSTSCKLPAYTLLCESTANCDATPVDELEVLGLGVPRHHWKLGQAKQLKNTAALALDQHSGPIGGHGANLRVHCDRHCPSVSHRRDIQQRHTACVRKLKQKREQIQVQPVIVTAP